MITIAIVAVCAIVAIIIILAIIIYQQMCLVNQINKRLLLITKESIEKERYTMAEMQEQLDSFESTTPDPNSTSINIEELEDETFDPHNFDTTTLGE